MSNTNQPNEVCQRGVDGSPGCGHSSDWFAEKASICIYPTANIFAPEECRHRCDFSVRVPEKPTVTEMTGSDPNFTGDETTDEYMKRIRGRVPDERHEFVPYEDSTSK